MTVEKYGTEVRSPWNEDGSWPCTHPGHCLTGVGQVNLVITPVGGFGWMLGEDLLDRYVARRVMPTRFICRTRRANAVSQYSTLDESSRVLMCVVDLVRTLGESTGAF